MDEESSYSRRVHEALLDSAHHVGGEARALSEGAQRTIETSRRLCAEARRLRGERRTRKGSEG